MINLINSKINLIKNLFIIIIIIRIIRVKNVEELNIKQENNILWMLIVSRSAVVKLLNK